MPPLVPRRSLADVDCRPASPFPVPYKESPMLSKRFFLSLGAALALASTAVLARPSADEPAPPCAPIADVVTEADLMAELPLAEEVAAATDPAYAEELALAAANWTFVGCIQLGSTCYDVFSEPNGTLWVCRACGTTNRPGPGKCRKLTPYEIATSFWCS